MSERPNDAPDGPIDEPGAEPPIEDEPGGLDDNLEPEAIDDGAGATNPEPEGEADEDEAAAMAAEAEVERDHGLRPGERRAARAAERTQIPIDPSLKIKDRASALFVILVIVVFGLIALNGLVLGRGGLLTPLPTLGPLPTAAPTAAPTTAPSAAPTAAPTTAPTTAPTPTPAAS